MKFVGIDLHKQTISLCVVNQARAVLERKRFACAHTELIHRFFAELGAFQAVIEATASYEWLWQLLEPMAQRLVLAHPSKLRIIAESTKKSDKLDAQVLADLLAMNAIPASYRPTPRQRAHRRLVRHRRYLCGQRTRVACQIHSLLSMYNADFPTLFSMEGFARLKKVRVDCEDRFVLDQLIAQWRGFTLQLNQLRQEMRKFAEQAPAAEAEGRAVLASIPYVGPVTIDVVLSELGDIHRFRNARQVCAYAGLSPVHRESGGKRKEGGLIQSGSPLLRWAMIQAAWRVVGKTNRWKEAYAQLKRRRGGKKAIAAIARRLLCVMTGMLKRGEGYRMAA